MADRDPYFAIMDYIIFSLVVSASVCIDIYFALSGGKQKTTSEYLLGNRNIKILPVALSLMVSFESSIMMLGYPAEIYVYGVMFWLFIVAFCIVNLLAIFILVPLIHPLKVTSVYEIFYMGIVLYGPAIAIKAVTDFPLWASVIVIGAASVIYTSIDLCFLKTQLNAMLDFDNGVIRNVEPMSCFSRRSSQDCAAIAARKIGIADK